MLLEVKSYSLACQARLCSTRDMGRWVSLGPDACCEVCPTSDAAGHHRTEGSGSNQAQGCIPWSPAEPWGESSRKPPIPTQPPEKRRHWIKSRPKHVTSAEASPNAQSHFIGMNSLRVLRSVDVRLQGQSRFVFCYLCCFFFNFILRGRGLQR